MKKMETGVVEYWAVWKTQYSSTPTLCLYLPTSTVQRWLPSSRT